MLPLGDPLMNAKQNRIVGFAVKEPVFRRCTRAEHL